MCFDASSVTTEFNVLLKQLDQSKTSDSMQFEETLKQLNLRQHRMSANQKEELAYLSTFTVIRKGDYQTAVSQLEKQFDDFQSLKVKTRISLTLSNLYAFSGNYEQAYQSLKFVTQHIESIEDEALKAVVYLAIANTYLLTNQYESSIQFSQLAIGNDDPIVHCKASAYHLAAQVKLSADWLAHGEKLKAVEAECLEVDQFIVVELLKISWFEQLLKNNHKNYEASELRSILTELEQVNRLDGSQVLKSISLLGESLKAKIYWYLSDLDQAEQVAKQVTKSPQNMGDNPARIEALRVLKDVAHERGEDDVAFEYLSQLTEIESALLKENQSKQVAFLNVEHGNMAQLLEIEQLNKANQVLQVEKKLASQKALNQKLVVLLLVTVLALLVYGLYRMKIRHGELESLAEMDHLTKVLNRKGLEEQIESFLSDSKSEAVEIHLAILDLDHFKSVNDQHGHLTGDWVLKHVIYDVKKLLDSRMLIGRLGGEEFGILGKNLSSKAMDERLELIRESIAQLDCSASDHDITVTASFGVTSSELSGHTMQMMLAHADLALYQAKSGGRNQVVRYHYLK